MVTFLSVLTSPRDSALETNLRNAIECLSAHRKSFTLLDRACDNLTENRLVCLESPESKDFPITPNPFPSSCKKSLLSWTSNAAHYAYSPSSAAVDSTVQAIPLQALIGLLAISPHTYIDQSVIGVARVRRSPQVSSFGRLSILKDNVHPSSGKATRPALTY